MKYTIRKLRVQRTCFCNQKVTSRGDPKFSKISPAVFEILGRLLRSPFDCRNTFSELSAFEWCTSQVSAVIILEDTGAQSFQNGQKSPVKHMLKSQFFGEFEYLSQLLTDFDDCFFQQLPQDCSFRIGAQHVCSSSTF